MIFVIFLFAILNLILFYLIFRATKFLVKSGRVVRLKVAQQGAIFHGLAGILSQPSPPMPRGERMGSIIHCNPVLLQTIVCHFVQRPTARNSDSAKEGGMEGGRRTSVAWTLQ